MTLVIPDIAHPEPTGAQQIVQAIEDRLRPRLAGLVDPQPSDWSDAVPGASEPPD